jgi:hypothetical protein
MSSHEFERPSQVNTAEMFRIRARASGTPGAEGGPAEQAQDLARLLRRYPDLAPVCKHIEENAFFDAHAAKAVVIQAQHDEGFMRSRPGVLHGALIVADSTLLRRFDREELGLPPSEGSDRAIDGHLPFLVRPAA